MIDLSAIAAAAVLRGLTQDDLHDLGTIARERETGRSEQLFARGDQAQDFYIALRGRFALTVPIQVLESQEEIAVEEKVPLDAFGWSVFVEPHRFIYSAYCTEDGAVFSVERGELEALMESNEHLGEQLACNIAELIGGRARVLQDLWADEVAQRTERVQYWKSREISTQWRTAVSQPIVRGPLQTWVSRLRTLLAQRSGQDPPASHRNDLH